MTVNGILLGQNNFSQQREEIILQQKYKDMITYAGNSKTITRILLSLSDFINIEPENFYKYSYIVEISNVHYTVPIITEFSSLRQIIMKIQIGNQYTLFNSYTAFTTENFNFDYGGIVKFNIVRYKHGFEIYDGYTFQENWESNVIGEYLVDNSNSKNLTFTPKDNIQLLFEGEGKKHLQRITVLF